MKYECKLIVKDRLSLSNNFNIYIKYKRCGNKLYKPFGNKINIIKYNEERFYDSLSTIFKIKESKDLINYIEEFNNMTTGQIVDLVVRHIKGKENIKIKETDKNEKLNNAISVAKQKVNTFIVEVK